MWDAMLLPALLGGLIAIGLLEFWSGLCLSLAGMWERLESWYWRWRWQRQWQRTSEDELAAILGVSRDALPALCQRIAEGVRKTGVPSAVWLAGLGEWGSRAAGQEDDGDDDA